MSEHQVDVQGPNTIIVASVSGGKDSAAMCLHLQEGLGYKNLKRVFADTGWEHDITYKYIHEVLTPRLGPIDTVGYPGGMRALVKSKQMFPSRLKRFCTQKLKVDPIRKYIGALLDQGFEVINAVGIRAGESESRSKMTEWEWSNDFDCWVWRPIISWSEQQVIDKHKTSGLSPNPLYLKGATRVGCWPCIFARKAEVKLVAQLSPERIDVIRAMEAEVKPSKAKEAVPERVVTNEDGTTTVHPALDALPAMPKTFFHGKLSRRGIPFPIDTIVTWSRTKYGGKELDPVVEDLSQPDGCVRWGMCEKAPDEPVEGREPTPPDPDLAPQAGEAELPEVREARGQGDGVVPPGPADPLAGDR